MRKGKKTGTITTFLGADAKIEGTIDFKGTIRIDGLVNGKIRSNGGTVIVGEKSLVNADIDVDVAIIMGEVNGTIEATSKIQICPPGKVVGDIYAPEISIDAGVTFNGNCAMKSKTITKSPSKELPENTTAENKAKIKNFPKNL